MHKMFTAVLALAALVVACTDPAPIAPAGKVSPPVGNAGVLADTSFTLDSLATSFDLLPSEENAPPAVLWRWECRWRDGATQDILSGGYHVNEHDRTDCGACVNAIGVFRPGQEAALRASFDGSCLAYDEARVPVE